jgi:hypothetical protein
MLVSAHGDNAEAVAHTKLLDARQRDHEGDMIVWQGVITQIENIRREREA